MKWNSRSAHLVIGTMVAPAVFLLSPVGYVSLAKVIIYLAIPGAAIGLVASALRVSPWATGLGAAFCGLVYPFAGLPYLLFVGKFDALESLTSQDHVLITIVSTIISSIVGLVPAVVAATAKRILVRPQGS